MSSDHLSSGIPLVDCKPDPCDYRITTTIGEYSTLHHYHQYTRPNNKLSLTKVARTRVQYTFSPTHDWLKKYHNVLLLYRMLKKLHNIIWAQMMLLGPQINNMPSKSHAIVLFTVFQFTLAASHCTSLRHKCHFSSTFLSSRSWL